MATFGLTRIDGTARSLVWRGDSLVDWVGGGAQFRLDGAFVRSGVGYSYRFDAAVASPDGHYAAIYERCGTKGLLLRDGRIVRELNRSFYYAHAYEHPVALIEHRGRVLLAHCSEYQRLDLFDAESGECLTARSKSSMDYFHSGLQGDPSGEWLIDAGWTWHPWCDVRAYALADALADPSTLDRSGRMISGQCEQVMACVAGPGRVIVSTGDEVLDDEEPIGPIPRLGLAEWDLASGSLGRSLQIGRHSGPMMSVGPDHVVTFFEHPRLLDLRTGEQVLEWPDLHTGAQTSCITWGKHGAPLALDPDRRRFALGLADEVVVIAIEL